MRHEPLLGYWACDTCRTAIEEPPARRALVAISEDRQWLVVLDAKDGWEVWRRTNDVSYRHHDYLGPDTGQSAEDVLASWLEGRE